MAAREPPCTRSRSHTHSYTVEDAPRPLTAAMARVVRQLEISMLSPRGRQGVEGSPWGPTPRRQAESPEGSHLSEEEWPSLGLEMKPL